MQKKEATGQYASFFSEARPWIDVLKPIWLGNPSLLSDHLPMEKEMFDFVVSDESSQLLLSHSIGAFQRGKKSVICGDPKQMVPSSYFKKKASDRDEPFTACVLSPTKSFSFQSL